MTNTASDPASASHARARPPAWLIGVVVLAGAALMSLELVGSRVLAPYFGNSIYVWGSLIGVFLAALSIGYALGGRLADRYPSAGALTTVCAGAAALTALATIAATPLQDGIVRWDPGLRLNPLLSAIAIFGPASVLIGMVSPFAVKLAARDLDSVGSTAGSLYGLSTAGSIVGTLGTSFYLIGVVGTTTVIHLIAFALALCAMVAAIAAASEPRGGRAAGVAGLSVALVSAVVVASGGTGDESLGRADQEWSPVFRAGGYKQQFTPSGAGKIRATRDSAYHRIRVVDYGAGVEDRDPVRVLHFDNSRQAAIRLDGRGRPDPAALPVFDYLRAFDLLPAFQPAPKRALFIGLGSGAAPMRLHRQSPSTQIDVVEIDKAVVDVARRWFAYDDGGPKLDTYVADGRSWLAGRADTYDLIVVDAYFADSLPFHLTTREFVRILDEHLTPRGLVAANLIGALEGERSKLFRSMHRTYAERFDALAVYPIPDESGEVRRTTFINIELIAGRRPLPERGSEARLLTTVGLDSALDETLTRIIDARYDRKVPHKGVPTLTDEFAPVDALISVDPSDAG